MEALCLEKLPRYVEFPSKAYQQNKHKELATPPANMSSMNGETNIRIHIINQKNQNQLDGEPGERPLQQVLSVVQAQ